MDILELALHNQQTAWKVLEHTGIIRAWERIGATVHLVGSLKSGLLAKSRDIDLHIYTDTLDIAASFSVMQELAERLSLKETHYNNLIQTEEECIEWHVLYEDEDRNTWKFDMIHIRKGSKYDGVVERATAAITNRLTPEIKQTILQIKFDVPDGVQIPGIEIYHAVFVGGVRSYEELECEQFTSLAAIARVSGINQQQLSHYASGLRVPRIEQRKRIVDGLHRIGKEFMEVV